MTTDARPRRRWLKYSLRSLLILITTLAVVLGRWVDSAHRQQRAVATIKGHHKYNRCEYDYERLAMSKAMSGSAGGAGGGSAGGSGFVFAYQVPEEPEVWWLPARARKAFGKDYFQNVYSVVFGEVHSGPDQPTEDQNRDAWRALAGLWNLQQFTSYLEPTDDDLVSLSRLQKLTRVDLMICPALGDRALANLARIPNLENLVITGGRFTPYGYAELANLKNLKSLRLVSPLHSTSQPRALGAVDVLDADLVQIAKLSELKELRLRTDMFSNTGLAELAKLKHLEKLDIGSVRRPALPAAVGNGAVGTAPQPNLPWGVTVEGIARLKKALPDCKITSDDRPL